MNFYKVYLSNKADVIIDKEDYQKLISGLSSGSFVKLKNAIVNPSFVSHIIPVSKKEALTTEQTDRQIEGHLDEARGVYVITKDLRPAIAELSDKFKP